MTKYFLIILIAVGIAAGFHLFHKLRQIGKPPEKQPVAEEVKKSDQELVGAPLETPSIGEEIEDEIEKPLHIVNVGLKEVGADQLLASVGSKALESSTISMVPTASNDGVIVSGENLQHVISFAELVKQYDRPAKLVTVNAVVGRLVRGKGLRVGLYDILKQAAFDGATNPLGELLQNVQWDLVTGVATFGTAYEARLAISLITDFEASKYGFEVVSRPSVTIVSGQSGVFSSGREVPVPVTTLNATGSQTSIQYKQAVFRFEVFPTVRPDGSIRLRLQQANSDVLSSSEIGGDSVPVLSNQELKTVMDLQPSEIAYLGGMRVRSERDDRRGVPGLGDIPGLNLIFATKDKGHEESELVILLSVDVHGKGQTPVPVRKAIPVKSRAWDYETATLSPRAGGTAKQAAKNALTQTIKKYPK
jgi:type II secretory pathway component GspD/PulD (secretin)